MSEPVMWCWKCGSGLDGENYCTDKECSETSPDKPVEYGELPKHIAEMLDYPTRNNEALAQTIINFVVERLNPEFKTLQAENERLREAIKGYINNAEKQG